MTLVLTKGYNIMVYQNFSALVIYKNQNIYCKYYNEGYVYSSQSKKYTDKISYGQKSIIRKQ